MTENLLQVEHIVATREREEQLWKVNKYIFNVFGILKIFVEISRNCVGMFHGNEPILPG